MSFFPALLALHLTALILMAGTTVIDFINYQVFWKLFDHQREQATGVLAVSAKSSRVIGISAGWLIITGVCMIALTHGLLAQQLWFRIKMIFVLLLICNGIFMGNRLSTKVRKLISANVPDGEQEVRNFKGKLQVYHLVQLCIFLIIIFLSAYKFS